MQSPWRIFVPLVLLVIGALLAGCAPLGLGAQPPAPATVRVVSLPFLTFAPLFIAQEEGYFAEQNLQVEFLRLEGSTQALPALARGEVDVVAGSVSAGLLNAIARDGRIKLVADKGYFPATGCGSTALVARRELAERGGFQDLAALRGLRLSLSRGTVEEYVVETALARAGLSLADVTLSDLQPEAELAALEQGALDVVATSEPWIARATQAGHGVVWKPFNELAPGLQWGIIAYGPTLLDDRPEVGERFMVAYLKAVRQYSQGKTERNLDIVARHTELDRQVLQDTCWPAIREDGRVDTPSVLGFQAWAVKRGLLQTTLGAEQIWEPRFVERAAKALERAAP